MFDLYPAIDLINGKVVNLIRGKFDQATYYDIEPHTLAENYETDGAKWLHIVDLDGAKDPEHRQLKVINRIIKSSKLKIQIGGGIRTHRDCTSLIDAGVSRVIIGSQAVKKADSVKSIIQNVGASKITIALDVNASDVEKPEVLVSAWEKSGKVLLWQMLDGYAEIQSLTFIVTAVENDGMLQGPKLALYKEIFKRYPQIHLIASGGIRYREDLEDLRTLGTVGGIVGKALLEKRVSIKDLLL